MVLITGSSIYYKVMDRKDMQMRPIKKLHQLGGEMISAYNQAYSKLQQSVGELQNTGNHVSIKLHQLGAEIREVVDDMGGESGQCLQIMSKQ